MNIFAIDLAMMPKITVITVTYNAASHLETLISSLRAQTDGDFEWIVVDGGSNDGTVECIAAASDIVTRWISESDRGIYDAMNKAVKMATGDYYLVCGADDRLAADAIANYRRVLSINPDCDLIVAGVQDDTGLRVGYRPEKRWLGHSAMFTHHSVGTCIKRSLHHVHGFYDLRFVVLADGLFLKRVATDPAAKIISADFVAGTFSPGGASSLLLGRALFELWAIQLLTEPNPLMQTLIYFARTIKHLRRIRSELDQ